MTKHWLHIPEDFGHRWPSGAEISLAEKVDLSPGDRVAILGPSGSGKTTLLRILGALDRPAKGQVEYHLPDYPPVIWGKKDRKFSSGSVGKLRSAFGFVFQDARLIPYLTILDNIISAPLWRGVTDKELRAQLSGSILPLRGILPLDKDREFLKRYPKNLSGGEKRRVALSRALLADPQILFADEPTSGVDQDTGGIVMEELDKWARAPDRQRLLLFVTHSPWEALSYANRWLVFSPVEKKDFYRYRLEEKDRRVIEAWVRKERARLDKSLRTSPPHEEAP